MEHDNKEQLISPKRYRTRAFLSAFVFSPLILTLGALADLMIGLVFFHEAVIPFFVFFSARFMLRRWARFVRRSDLPAGFLGRYLPIIAAFTYYMAVWFVAFDPRGDEHFFSSGFLLVQVLPQHTLVVLLAFMNILTWFPYLQLAIYGSIALTVSLTAQKSGRPLTQRRGLYITAVFVTILSGVAIFRNHEREANILPFSSDSPRLSQSRRIESRLYDLYRPFTEENLLRPLAEPTTLSIASDYPKLDGATSAYPIYAAAVEMIYQGLNAESVADYVQCTKTERSYENLVGSEVDVIFGLQPSQQQRELARRNSFLFSMTPIAKDAFIFFVNKENPVDNLTVQQIQDIYQKKITSWKAVGGAEGKILAFQRPENSGSQTIMIAEVMKGKALPLPLAEVRAATMGTVIQRVADYRNQSSAIGYSFFYYATRMNPDENVKLLSVNGIAPTPENIRAGTYPLIVNVYAITGKYRNTHTQKLIEWFLSEQGQRLIENIGYIKL